MNKYTFSFTGRQSGAIGIFYQIQDTYKAKDVHEALSFLYEDYEHQMHLVIRENGVKIAIPNKINFVEVRKNSTRQRNENGEYLKTRSDSERN